MKTSFQILIVGKECQSRDKLKINNEQYNIAIVIFNVWNKNWTQLDERKDVTKCVTQLKLPTYSLPGIEKLT